MRSNYKRLGEYIEQFDVRNKSCPNPLGLDSIKGISSIYKSFIKTKANLVGVSPGNYKVVKPNQFGFNPNTARMGDKIPIALNSGKNDVLVSSIYPTFKIIDEDKLHPEYLMMWFRRPEFDRYARFKSHGSAREVFDFQEMCDVELPVPPIDKQRKIVKEYNAVINRISLNEQLNLKLEETAQALYKNWFVDFEFPNANVQPYKSAGGKMVYNEKLDQEIPLGWGVKNLVELATIKGGKRMPKGAELSSIKNDHPYIKVADMGDSKFVMLNHKFEYVPEEPQRLISRYIVSEGDLIISIVGTIGIIKIIHNSLNLANLTENCVKLTQFKRINSDYLYHFLNSTEGKEEIKMRNVGAVQAKLPIYNIESLPILCPTEQIFESFSKKMEVLNASIINSQNGIVLLKKFKSVLLAKISKVESLKTAQVI